jgi:tyramine---L-glutamate ligase
MPSRVFLYEYATAGGAWDEWHQSQLVRALAVEGDAMFRGLAADLVGAGCRVQALIDDPATLAWSVPYDLAVPTVGSPQQRQAAFAACVRDSQAVIVVAPESGGVLEAVVSHVEALGGRLLSADSSLVALASDKQATAQWLAERGVAAAAGIRREVGDRSEPPWPGPWVRKPLDGAGSCGVELCTTWESPCTERRRWERYYPGQAASVAALCGPDGRFVLEPCAQQLTENGRIEYLGGWLPLPPLLRDRALSLARRAVDALPTATGYVGLDLVLGADAQGSQDVIIEVNPRLTTSYLGLRRASRVNLARLWLDVAAGRTPVFDFDCSRVEFSADGAIGGKPAI